MPIPKPSKSESQNDYIGRCMHEISGEYEHDQAVAICISTYQKETMSKPTEMRIADKLSGIHLLEGLEDACWEGYIAVGMKEKDGRIVPNCVPADAEMEKIKLEGVNLADYPWEQCIADQTARYGDEETANKVCGYIKSKYGSKE